MNLFNYPNTAGYKEHETSKDAAIAIESNGRAEKLRDLTYSAILNIGAAGMTGKEIAASLREDITSIRPRLTELKERGLIFKSGIRRNKQHVWVA